LKGKENIFDMTMLAFSWHQRFLRWLSKNNPTQYYKIKINSSGKYSFTSYFKSGKAAFENNSTFSSFNLSVSFHQMYL